MTATFSDAAACRSAVDFLKRYDRFALICHLSPDGDAIGAVFLLKLALERLGKIACVCCQDPPPENLTMLSGLCEVFASCPFDTNSYAAVAVDCGDLGRLGTCRSVFEGAVDTLNIDHHATNEFFARLNHVESDAAAASEIVWRLVRAMGVPCDADMGLCAYVGMATDSGNFSFSNVTPRTFLAVSQALETGFDLPGAANRLFRTRTLPKARVLGYCLDHAQFLCGGRVAVTCITLAELQALLAKSEDVEGISEFLRDIDCVEASACLRELEAGGFKASLRSSDRVDVSVIAQKFGGGGHKRAAGCTLHTEKEEALRNISGLLCSALREV